MIEIRITTVAADFDFLGRTFSHPTTNYNLLEAFSMNEISNSDELKSGIDGGHIILTDTNSTVISDPLIAPSVAVNVSLTPGSAGNKFAISWSLSGILQTTSTSFSQVGEQIMIPHADNLISGATTITAILVVSTNTEGASTGEVDLFNYTDFVQEGLVTSIANGGWFETESEGQVITGGKAYRPRMRRVGGTGSNNAQIESAVLILTVT